MRVCAASSCKSISELSSGLTFHPLPKDEFLRDQWIDLLGIDDSKITDQTRVCSLHFKPKDFVNFKRNLKTGSIPSLYLSKEKSVPIVDDIAKNNDNSNEFDGEEEKKEESLSATDKDSAKDGSQIVTLQVKEEEKPVRRASRKAALLAAEKIQRTVKEYGLVEGVRSQSPEPRRDSSISMRMKLSQEFHMALLKNGAPKVAQKSSSGKSSIRVGYSYTGQNELYMECFEEVLSPVQVAAYHQAQQEYDKVMKYILSRRASKSEKVRIIYTSHDGEVLNTVGDSEIRLTNPSTNTGNICQKNITVISDTAAERSDPVQMKLQVASTVKPSSVQTTRLGNCASNVLVDTSTGVVMGTLPKDTTILQSTVGQSTTTDIQENVVTVKHQDVSNQSGKPSVLHTSLIQGSSTSVSAHSLMEIKPKPLAQVNSNLLKESTMKLRRTLLEEKCFQEPVLWLNKLKMLPKTSVCLVCSKSAIELVSDPDSEDRYMWKCTSESCGRKSQITRPNVFGRFGIPLCKLLKLTYHWAVQSDVKGILSEVGIDVYMARSVWRTLQEVCARALVLKSKKLGGPGTMVEVSFAYMGRFSILGAYDRGSGRVRMKAISSSMGWSTSVCVKSLEPWLLPNSVIVSSEVKMKEITRSGHKFLLAPGVTSPPEGELGVSKIKNYLQVQLSDMFGQFIVAQLKLDTVQGYLDEIQWRERFGTTPSNAFWNIIDDIGEQSGRKTSSIGFPHQQKQLPEKVITMIGQKNDLKYQRDVRGQIKRPAESVVLNAPPQKKAKSETVSVALVEYYYAKKEGNVEVIAKESKVSTQFKCHICKKMLDNNIKAMKHISGHIENTRQRSPDLSDLTQCKYCFRDFETPYSMQCHIEAVHMKMDTLACGICNQAFSSEVTLIAHMKTMHVECEMPYLCNVCGFRCSMHQQVLEHFQQVHNGSDKFQCHYCLRVFSASISLVQKIGLTQNFFLHLQKHQQKSQARKCPTCCLIFTTPSNVKTHQIVDHISMAGQPGVIRMKPRENEKIVMLKDPHIKPTRISKVRVEPSTSEALLSPAALEEKYMDIIFNDDTSQLSCVECTERIDDEHFRRCLSCSQCRYATNCGKAFVEHMIVHHSKLKKKRPSLINLKPTYCQRPMFCICGYNTINGNDLARHLAICHKRSCYISRAKALAATIKKEEATIQLQPQSAFFPPLVVLDENEEKSINDSFARVHTRRSTATSTQVALESSVPISQKILNVSKEVTKQSTDQPLHMLNVLGLVRKIGDDSSHSNGTLTETTENEEIKSNKLLSSPAGVESEVFSTDIKSEGKEEKIKVEKKRDFSH